MTGSIIDAFKALQVAAAKDASDHEAIYEVSYQYLSKVKNYRDLGAFHNCMVALINCDRYYKALDLISKVPSDVHEDLPLEKAYVYYKTGKIDQLKSVYEASMESTDLSPVLSRALKHVMSQGLYQNGQFEESLKLYRELIASPSVDNRLDLACNERAILSQLAIQKRLFEAPALSVQDEERPYDLIFNEALIELAKGNTSLTLELLETASALCLEQNLDGPVEDLNLELAPIKLTIAYVHQVSGNTEEALRLLQSSDMSSVTDLMTKLVLRNNYYALAESPENVNFMSRELNYQKNMHQLRHKLTRPQYQVLLKNHILLSYQSGTLSSTSTYCGNQFYQKYSGEFLGDFTPLIFRILVKLNITFDELQSHEDHKAVNRKLYKYVSSRLNQNTLDDHTIAAAILLVHTNSKVSKYDQSVLVLESLADQAIKAQTAKLYPAIFGTLINLYEVSSCSEKLQLLYDALFEEFKSLTLDDFEKTFYLFNYVLAVAFKASSWKSAIDAQLLFELLNKVDPHNALVSSRLSGECSMLAPVDELASSENVEDLLAVNIESLETKQVVSTPKLGRKPPTDYKVTKKQRKPKFSKHKFVKPANEFNPEKELDKERWLPLKLRSYYKPSKKELKKKSGGHQGAVESSPAPSGSHQASGGASSKNKKKKKKGKK